MALTYTPVNSFLSIQYKLTDEQIKKYYPITPDNTVNLSPEDMEINPAFNSEWSYEEAIESYLFTDIMFRKIGADRILREATIKDISDELEAAKYKIGKKIFLKSSFPGIEKPKFIPEEGIIESIINPIEIMAIEKNKVLKPISNYVELEFPIPPEFIGKDVENFNIDPLIKDIENATLEDFWRNGSMYKVTTNRPIIVSVGEDVKNFSEGEKVLISNTWDFALNNVVRMDKKKKTLYFITDAKNILAKVKSE